MKTLQTIVLLLVITLVSCSKSDDSATPVAVNPIEISSFGPNTGAKNTIVIITGKGFSGNATSNTVTLNDKVCPVLEASSTKLTISVPPKSATGNFKVTVNGFSQESSVFTYVDTVVVSTLAGSTFGFADGQGNTAKFDSPEAISVDNAGNLFVADPYNHKIRKITPTGLVTTLAGSTVGFADGQGAGAQFNNVKGLTIDTAGNLYVADTNNNKIRKVSPTGIVTSIAGSSEGFTDGQGTAAQFTAPSGICIDTAGNLYVTDRFNHKIRKISSTGLVTTLAGSTDGFNDAQGILAQFSFPFGICIDSFGNLYVTDRFNNKIRKISPDGNVKTIAGSALGYQDGIGNTAEFSAPKGIIIDVSGVLYIADTGNEKIRKIVID